MDSHVFSQVPVADIARSRFNRSHGHKTTLDEGYLVPIFVDEALPGDTFEMNGNFFARLATPMLPIMDNVHLDVFFFAVPNRLLWNNWQRFMGEQDNPGDSTDFLVPVVTYPEGGFGVHSIFDYFGVPIGNLGTGIRVSALFPRAYNLIYNEWFRDQNLIDSVPKNVGDGPDDAIDYALLKRAKRHDYFTACLPWPQKGPGVELSLGTTAPVIPAAADTIPYFDYVNDSSVVRRTALARHGPNEPDLLGYAVTADEGGALMTGPALLRWSDSPGDVGLIADLSAATAATINSLRQAFQIQKLLERDARGGTRYVEILHAHFGVVSPDSRLQRPEYLGGGSIPFIVNPVTQTAPTSGADAKGSLAAYGVAGGQGLGFAKSFVEHCVIVGLVNIRADITYQNGLDRKFSRRTRYDFYWPAFAHLGEQAVLSKEIFCDGTEDDDTVFGYQERWAEYRYFPSKVTGKLRSVVNEGLDAWHLAQDFSVRPVLNQSFIEDAPPIDRIVAVPAEPHFILDSWFELSCTRPMPVYSVPGLTDHF